jgi:uncharacterized metal-binding protein YceD (DUF177 family)
VSAPLPWSYRTTEVPEGGLRERREASAQERSAVAAELGLLSLDSLVADVAIRALGKGSYRLKGTLTAQLTQACVITLEPVAQRVEDSFDVDFWPPGTLPQSSEDEVEALASAEIEPIEHGRIDAGRIVFETLSAGIDPYPRAPGAAFSEAAAPTSDQGAESPFGALKKLKDRQ